jgi:hypothetical protein
LTSAAAGTRCALFFPSPLNSVAQDMSEILSTRNIAAKGADGWRVEYCVGCDDGRRVDAR